MMRSLRVAIVAVVFAGCSGREDLADARRLAEEARAEIARAQSLQREGKAQEAEHAALIAQDKIRSARDEYLAAKADRSRDASVLVEFANFCEQTEDYDLAGEALARAADLTPGRPDIWYKAAVNFIEARGRYLDRAADALNKAEEPGGSAESRVSTAEIATARGDLFMALGLPHDAAPKYAEALASDPQRPRARIGAAGAALLLGDVERSATLADSFTAPTPAESILLDRTLRAAYMNFRRDRVIVPDTAAAQRGLAKICVRLGFLQEGRLAIERAVHLEDTDVFSWNLLGSLSRQAGELERARVAFTRSLELEPDQPRTQQALEELGAAND